MATIVYNSYVFVDFMIRFLADYTLIIMVIITAISLMFFVPNKYKFDRISKIVLVCMTALVLAQLLAMIYQPESARPFIIMDVEPKASYVSNNGFPSNHSLLASSLLFAVWYAVRKKWLSILMAILAVMVCLGRVLALVHTPVDVIGAFIISAVASLWYLNDRGFLPGKKSWLLRKTNL